MLLFILFSIGCLGVIGSLFYLLICILKKSEKKKLGFKLAGGFIVLVIVSLLGIGGTSEPNNNDTTSTSTQADVKEEYLLTDSDKSLLTKTYADFSTNEIAQFSEIEKFYSDLSDSYKQSIQSDFKRLSEERDIQVAKLKAEADEAAAKATAEAEVIKEYYPGIYNIHEKVMMNGANTKAIGKIGLATYDKNEMTDESLIKFYNEKIKNSGYNAYTLIDKNNIKKGLVFPGCINIGSYGNIDDDGCIIKSETHIIVEADKITKQ